ncbi:hypothetical protein BH10ACI4_BH10ACI4_28320 [soil metagenome]
MRSDILKVFRESHAAATIEIELCELLIVGHRNDDEVCAALAAIQARYEALADELETQIQALK